MAENTIGLDEPTTIDKRLRTRSLLNSSAETVHVEVMTIGGDATHGDYVQPTTALVATGAFGLPVRIIPTTSGMIGGVDILNTITVQPAAGTSWNVAGGVSAVIGNSSGVFTTANPLPVMPTTTVPISGNTTAILTTGSKVQVEPVAGAVFGISGNATAILTTGSKVQVEPVVGAVFPISGNATVVLSALPGAVTLNGLAGTSGLLVYGADGTASNSTARPIKVNASQELLITGAVSISGNATAVLTTGSKSQVEPIAGAVFPISGNATAILTTGSKVQVEPVIGAVFGISGNATAILTTGSKSQVEPIAGSVFPISGNATAILSTASKVQVEPVAGAVFGISGNATAILTTGSKVQVEPVAGAVFGISGNATAILTTASRIITEQASGFTPYGDHANATFANVTLVASGATALLASAAGLRMNITALSFVNEGATGTLFEIRSGGSATCLFRGFAALGGGGLTLAFPMPLRGTSGEVINVFQSGPTTAQVHISGYRSA